MTINLLAWRKRDEGETRATFGEAKLVKKVTGKIELAGGSVDDGTAAKEWASLFLHEATGGDCLPLGRYAASMCLVVLGLASPSDNASSL